MSTLDEVRQILADSLQLSDRHAGLDASTRLLGSLPELDSMAVVNVITALEEHYGFTVDDDEISADTFETLGTLADFVDKKLTT
ncbi:MAG TPA: acyl carrier protein [Acidiferrobacterales bacterium]